ncbi:unnamed protein product [Brassica oleracea var. botrytis]|uniref:RNA helicase aquarius N-terminal domain-containing protein n=1 Tax=Brassica oleracea TaxID=3712 RepID=A0A3P6CV25_BRAOL|nr:unnamed protein product [Brassica oleracea]
MCLIMVFLRMGLMQVICSRSKPDNISVTNHDTLYWTFFFLTPSLPIDYYRYLRPLVADIAVFAKCRLSVIYKHEKGIKLFAQLVDLLRFYAKEFFKEFYTTVSFKKYIK